MTRLVKTRENISGLPNGFTEVEYLESTGTQYIDTGIKYKPSLSLKGKLTRTEMGASGSVMLLSTSTTNPVLYFPALNASSKQDRYVWRRNGYSEQSYYYSFDAYPVTEEVYLDAINDKLYLNGSLVKSGMIAGMNGYSSPYESNSNLYLYGIGNTYRGVGKIYYCQIWDNTTLVRDFIPCLDNNGRPCMYDLAGKKTYYNLGTDEFTYGRKIIPVEYLESAGSNNYIATSLNYFADYEIGIKLRNNVSNKALGNSATNCMQRYNATNPYWSFTSGGTNAFTPNALITDYHVMKWKDGKIYTDDVLITEKAKDKGTTEMTLFGAGTYFPNMIYFCKLWNPDDGTLVRDYIPCIDENNVPFMFDRVTHTIFDNAGVGTFSYGNPVYTTKTRLIKEPLLPSGFKRVEYLESSGTQYIDTGIAGSSTLTLEMIAQKSGSGYGVYFGAGTGNNRIQAIYFSDYNNARIGNINSNLGPDSEKFNVVVDALNKNVIYNGTSYPFAYTSALTNLNIFIFTRNEGSSYADKATAKCWSFKILDNGIIVRDFIPALDTTNTPCMYDTVTQTPFYNQGSGSFTYGNILPYETKTSLIPSWLEDYTFVNYIESTGTQYIDTGIKPTDDYGYRIKNTYTAGQGEQCAIGCMDSGNRFVGIYTSGSANAISGAWGNFVGFLPSYTWTTGTILDVKCNYKNSRKMIIDNTEMKDISDIHITGTISNSIYIGARNYGSNVTKMQGKIYCVEITKGQEVIANYIPAIRKSDNAVGMLDIVNRVFYTNQGTGVFSYG